MLGVIDPLARIMKIWQCQSVIRAINPIALANYRPIDPELFAWSISSVVPERPNELSAISPRVGALPILIAVFEFTRIFVAAIGSSAECESSHAIWLPVFPVACVFVSISERDGAYYGWAPPGSYLG